MNWKSSRWRSVPGAATIATLATLILLRIAPGEGWPANHEGSSFYLRTLVYAQHIKLGDWLPIWSSTDNDGFGSAQPLLYHKLFYLLSGALYAFSDQIKDSILISVWLCLIVGAFGIYALSRALGCGRWLAWGGGAMLLTANYTTTSWLTRGALAEFSAAMLLPWVLRSFINWLACETHRYRVSSVLGLLIGLTFVAHSVLAYYLALLLGMCTLLLVFAGQVPLRRLHPLPLLSAGIAFVLISGPYLVAMYIVGDDYEISRLLPSNQLPDHQIKPLMWYLWQPDFQWGKAWDQYTVQLDTPTLWLLTLGSILFGVNRTARSTSRIPADDKRIGVLGLSIVCLISMFLQSAWAVPFYKYFPGAAFIQFPWRLLAVLTPGLIALSLSLWQRQPTWLAVPCILCGIASMIWLSGVWFPPPFDYFTLRLAGNRFSVLGEFIPAKAGTTMPYDASSITKMLEQAGCELAIPPSVATSKEDAEEVIAREYYMHCQRAGIYPLPLFSSPLHVVRIGGTDARRCGTAAEAPTLCAVRLSEAGSYHVLVKMPTVDGFILR